MERAQSEHWRLSRFNKGRKYHSKGAQQLQVVGRDEGRGKVFGPKKEVVPGILDYYRAKEGKSLPHWAEDFEGQ